MSAGPPAVLLASADIPNKIRGRREVIASLNRPPLARLA